ncbi:DUF2614 family zinc ribbon-containing protein [Sporosarcina trichiuri]|uniref:DUF2614 family zinc ribbon-containing protein n=1 Tax=Sporosarcina trichiuri TaxID=3056445 RepID=UPI0025B52714|nr:DUF2614 family zinc ribbon-containing protein [Sporosarcina sp. 0.2-SM1T-5]WJY27479.1 DUF2614 family zinc ribbon-containing protein [Sporosarcina sp. 0.2-SM1T-5]
MSKGGIHMILVFILLGLFFLLVAIMLPFAIIKMAVTKPVACPQCGTQLKLISNTGKCTRCKAKLYKHMDGDYRLRA